jgi:hypothetical protein
MTSITAMIGRRISGASFIQKRPRKAAPFLTKPSTVTAMNTPKPSTAVTAMCEVGVKEVGTSPR